MASTVGASFLVKKVLDVDSGTTVRLQLWDTAGQERFRAISRLYYRGASAVLLVYSLIDEQSFEEMGQWLQEMKDNLGQDVVIHVVGTKSDIVAQDPNKRMVSLERCITFVAENLYPDKFQEPVVVGSGSGSGSGSDGGFRSTGSTSYRSSGFWGQDIGWDCCHEISSSSGEGIEEVFRSVPLGPFLALFVHDDWLITTSRALVCARQCTECFTLVSSQRSLWTAIRRN